MACSQAGEETDRSGAIEQAREGRGLADFRVRRVLVGGGGLPSWPAALSFDAPVSTMGEIFRVHRGSERVPSSPVAALSYYLIGKSRQA
jgi:hypothetical protein